MEIPPPDFQDYREYIGKSSIYTLFLLMDYFNARRESFETRHSTQPADYVHKCSLTHGLTWDYRGLSVECLRFLRLYMLGRNYTFLIERAQVNHHNYQVNHHSYYATIDMTTVLMPFNWFFYGEAARLHLTNFCDVLDGLHHTSQLNNIDTAVRGIIVNACNRGAVFKTERANHVYSVDGYPKQNELDDLLWHESMRDVQLDAARRTAQRLAQEQGKFIDVDNIYDVIAAFKDDPSK